MTNANSFDWSQFRQKIEIEVPPGKVFEAWTDQELITRWFVTAAVIEPKKNGRLNFEWLGGDKLDTRIIQIRRPNLLVFPFGSNGEKVAIRIRKIATGSLVELHQYDMKTTPKYRISMHMGCREGWAFFMANLKAFLEYGIDLRSHNPRRSYRQGYLNS